MKKMRKQRGFTLVELLFSLVGLIALVGAGSLAYIGFHFLHKFW
jgi:type II secretory pathway pseudopilin PulG